MRPLLMASLVTAVATASAAQHVRTLTLDLDIAPPAVRRGHLDLGGAAPDGTRIDATNRWLERDGRPFVPAVGEIHYSRVRPEQWDEAVRKIKAGGIDTIATYVFWNMHERTEGVFDWSDGLDLRRFVETCRRHGFRVIVRVGPFCHGEVRNGGLPDWLYGKPFEVRSDDPGYLALVDRLYGEIGRRLEGLFFKDGGPIIGVQLENEYQHSAAPWEFGYPGSPREFTVADRDTGVTHVQITAGGPTNPFVVEGRDHMAKLKTIARRNGLEAPLYTATGWGNASIVEGGSIPVSAAYPYPFWAARKPSPFYLYKDIRLHPDYPPASYATDDYPSIAAELGGGIQITYTRRPVVPPESLAPLIVRTLGSGSNGIGYYMYHGGSNPVFDGTFFNEQAGGLARINYDYQAPIGEFGQQRLHHRSLRILHHFLHEFGDRLAPMVPVLPADAADLRPEDVDTPRFAARTDGRGAFVFAHNFQDHAELRRLAHLRFEFTLGGRTLALPVSGTLDLEPGTSAILPLEFEVGALRLRSATVQPLTVLRLDGLEHHVFVSLDGLPPEFLFAGDVSFDTIDTPAGASRHGDDTLVRGPAGRVFRFSCGDDRFVVLPYALALQAVRSDDGRLWFSEADLFPASSPGGIELRSIGAHEVLVRVYPESGFALRSDAGESEPVEDDPLGLPTWRVRFAEARPAVDVRRVGPRRIALAMRDGLGDASDAWVRVPYVGDRVAAFIDGALVADHFWQGSPWELSLRGFADRLRKHDMILLFHAAPRDASWLQDIPPAALPDFGPEQKSMLKIDGFEIVPEYRSTLRLVR
jgi:hypothetical protein